MAATFGSKLFGYLSFHRHVCYCKNNAGQVAPNDVRTKLKLLTHNNSDIVVDKLLKYLACSILIFSLNYNSRRVPNILCHTRLYIH